MKKQILRANQIRMFKVTKETLDMNAVIVNTIPDLQTASADFKDIVKAIDEKMVVIESTTKGLTTDKWTAKREMVDWTLMVANRAMAYASTTGDGNLLAIMHGCAVRLATSSDVVCYAKCQKVSSYAESILPDLANWNVNIAMIQELNDRIAAFAAVQSNQRTQEIIVNTAIKDVGILITQGIALLKSTVDKGVKSMTMTEGTFVNEYLSGRKTLNLGHRHTQFKGAALNKANNQQITNVDIKFISADGTFEIRTDENGKYRERLNPDTYNIIVTHPDFDPFTIDGVKIQAGELKVENFEMVPKVN